MEANIPEHLITSGVKPDQGNASDEDHMASTRDKAYQKGSAVRLQWLSMNSQGTFCPRALQHHLSAVCPEISHRVYSSEMQLRARLLELDSSLDLMHKVRLQSVSKSQNPSKPLFVYQSTWPHLGHCLRAALVRGTWEMMAMSYACIIKTGATGHVATESLA